MPRKGYRVLLVESAIDRHKGRLFDRPMKRFGSSHIKTIATLAVFAAGAALLPAADGPREKLLLDFGWKFHLGDAPDAGARFDYPEAKDLAKTHLGEIGQEGELADLAEAVRKNIGADVSFVQADFKDTDWRALDLPHDWAVELPFDEKSDVKHGFKPVGPGYPQNDIGWYRRQFDLPKSDQGRALWLAFDGVYRNSLVWLNGHCLGRHLDGYSSFRYDISPFANYGGKNTLVVRVDASRFEGWFYEGAGIYRHVWLEKTSPVGVAPDGIFVWSTFSNNVPQGPATVHVQAQLQNARTSAAEVKVLFQVLDEKENVVAQAPASATLAPGSTHEVLQTLPVNVPTLWSPETPHLYRLVTSVASPGGRSALGSQVIDRVETTFGIRTVAFDTEKGFLLNGSPYTIKGTCNHQDHAGIGSALPDAMQYYRVKKLKELGSNGYRTSHNPPTPELLDACDRLGLLVMDETRRMDTNEFVLDELRSLIRRDRNHPSVFMWSLGNEETYFQGKAEAGFTADMGYDFGARVTRVMQDVAHEMDPTRQCTVAMNAAWGYGISGVIDVQGFNYHTGNIDPFHTKFPTQPTIGSEVASTRVTRAIYIDSKTNGYVASYATNGVSRPWEWWPYFATHPFTSGGFIWTGFDYRGEPTPYKWPCINSHFGVMDMCGFPKDIYFYYQAWWIDKPLLHVLPHWNWPDRVGQNVPVRVFSNCKEVELFLNGKSLGKQTMLTNLFLDWNVTYEPGVLSAKGYNDGKTVIESSTPTTGPAYEIELAPDRTTIAADGEDVSVINVFVHDAKGRVVPTADNLIHFELSGPGRIIGVGNGDPSSHEADKADQRKVFGGCAQVIVQSAKKSGTLRLTATADGLKKATAKISADSVTLRPAVP